jgi:hypothetical protein
MTKHIQGKAIRCMVLIILGIGFLGLAGKAMAQDPVPAIDFEEEGTGADLNWRTFENDDNPPLEIVDNPDASGINTSDRVAKFTTCRRQPLGGNRRNP